MTTIALILIPFLIIIAAIANAVMDTIKFNYEQSIFIEKNPEYWNPAISWKNKYKDFPRDQRPRFPGATTVLVFLTDAWHLFKSVMLTSLLSAIALAYFVSFEWKWVMYVGIFITGKFLFGFVFEFAGKVFERKETNK